MSSGNTSNSMVLLRSFVANTRSPRTGEESFKAGRPPRVASQCTLVAPTTPNRLTTVSATLLGWLLGSWTDLVRDALSKPEKRPKASPVNSWQAKVKVTSWNVSLKCQSSPRPSTRDDWHFRLAETYTTGIHSATNTVVLATKTSVAVGVKID